METGTSVKVKEVKEDGVSIKPKIALAVAKLGDHIYAFGGLEVDRHFNKQLLRLNVESTSFSKSESTNSHEVHLPSKNKIVLRPINHYDYSCSLCRGNRTEFELRRTPPRSKINAVTSAIITKCMKRRIQFLVYNQMKLDPTCPIIGLLSLKFERLSDHKESIFDIVYFDITKRSDPYFLKMGNGKKKITEKPIFTINRKGTLPEEDADQQFSKDVGQKRGLEEIKNENEIKKKVKVDTPTINGGTLEMLRRAAKEIEKRGEGYSIESRNKCGCLLLKSSEQIFDSELLLEQLISSNFADQNGKLNYIYEVMMRSLTVGSSALIIRHCKNDLYLFVYVRKVLRYNRSCGFEVDLVLTAKETLSLYLQIKSKKCEVSGDLINLRRMMLKVEYYIPYESIVKILSQSQLTYITAIDFIFECPMNIYGNMVLWEAEMFNIDSGAFEHRSITNIGDIVKIMHAKYHQSIHIHEQIYRIEHYPDLSICKYEVMTTMNYSLSPSSRSILHFINELLNLGGFVKGPEISGMRLNILDLEIGFAELSKEELRMVPRNKEILHFFMFMAHYFQNCILLFSNNILVNIYRADLSVFCQENIGKICLGLVLINQKIDNMKEVETKLAELMNQNRKFKESFNVI